MVSSHHIAYIDKDMTRSNPTKLVVPTGLIAIEVTPCTKSYTDPWLFFSDTRQRSFASTYTTHEKKKPEPSPLKKLLEKPVEKQTDPSNQKEIKNKNVQQFLEYAISSRI